MTRLRFVLAWAVILLVASGCASKSTGPRTTPPPFDRNLITQEELSQRRFPSVYAAIEALRTNWLTMRGPSGGEVQVYLDGQYLGGVKTLNTIPMPNVEYIRHLDGIEAAARYGRGHEQGAILVTTRHGGP